MKREESIDYNIKAAWHAISRMYNQQAVKYGITTSIGFVLLNINTKEGTPATKIAPLMGLESRSLTRMLKSMEEKGLIYKKPDPEDKRSVRIFLTDLGVEKKAISRETVKTFNEEVFNTIEPEKLEAFFDVIHKVNDIIDKNEIYNTKESVH
ncbi:MarR family transcriptional regulator [Marivirga tractuosa]|uniref:Transcriptional regulator, MarR family n=1 Tax=Marivirga tractuosa (strain ATCC 23168 / DSM 4126 / NBRC 15989 / NCIMB 1408 / VKM B-1430 / H-43) TaxID=643867 RepID=E4TQX5_MARTH|nr:MarR family transcriptional regulator [Marivirga tractuosa]ADR21675.1 transcriptional regulator, MarR family [Marivirga tractuosa DSM 4126]BDD13868.1 MarR family transcriptional regulator [Marivirga tractuosa]